MFWELVGNWQQKRTVDLSELGWHWPVSSKPGNYPDEQAAETLHWDGGHNISSHEKKRKHTQWVSATYPMGFVTVWFRTCWPQTVSGRVDRLYQANSTTYRIPWQITAYNDPKNYISRFMIKIYLLTSYKINFLFLNKSRNLLILLWNKFSYKNEMLIP